MNKLVSIIIVNWNGLDHLKRCLPSIYKQDYSNFEIILVDNASTDESLSYINKNFPKIVIVRSKTNTGFAQGNNIGYRKARGKYILFLNNDTVVTNNFLSRLVTVLVSNNNIGGVQSKILLLEKKSTLDSVGAFLTTTGFLYHFGFLKKDAPKYSKQIEIYSAKGACMLFKKEVIEKTLVRGDVFDKSYFAYFEETDLCHRIWLAGYKIVFVPDSIVYHKLGSTAAKLAEAFVLYHSYKNRISSYIKNLGPSAFITLIPIHIFLCVGISFVYLLTLQPVVSWVIIKAIGWNLLNLGSTLADRTIVQTKIRKEDDKSFFPTIVKNRNLRYYVYLFRGLDKYDD